jgi:hypothetical protein
MPTPAALPKQDTKPQPPVEPALEDCCRSGCNPCVFDIYAEELERYEQRLAQWEARQAQPQPASGR